MSGVETIAVAEDEAGLRLDRWFKRHYPGLTHGRLEKMLRTGQVRLDGKRVRANARINGGQMIRVPPVPDDTGERSSNAPPTVSAGDAEAIQASVLYRDNHLIAINKPPGLAVQGGTGTSRHVDAMLDALRFDGKDRPRLVHRLDKDTSGVLLIARTVSAAAHFAEAFRSKRALKTYWALVAGAPNEDMGVIEAAIKKGGGGSEKVYAATDGKRAVTNYMMVDRASDKLAWLALAPETGRTHQLRVHCAMIGNPILGDGKYGGKGAFPEGAGGIAAKMQLHARWIRVFGMNGEKIEVTAPLTEHMKSAWKFFGFDENAAPNNFENGEWL
jgi:23S rRNA pseudouridine955/2504/2580 synthase